MAITSSNILYHHGNFTYDIIELICEMKSEFAVIEIPLSIKARISIIFSLISSKLQCYFFVANKYLFFMFFF